MTRRVYCHCHSSLGASLPTPSASPHTSRSAAEGNGGDPGLGPRRLRRRRTVPVCTGCGRVATRLIPLGDCDGGGLPLGSFLPSAVGPAAEVVRPPKLPRPAPSELNTAIEEAHQWFVIARVRDDDVRRSLAEVGPVPCLKKEALHVAHGAGKIVCPLLLHVPTHTEPQCAARTASFPRRAGSVRSDNLDSHGFAAWSQSIHAFQSSTCVYTACENALAGRRPHRQSASSPASSRSRGACRVPPHTHTTHCGEETDDSTTERKE